MNSKSPYLGAAFAFLFGPDGRMLLLKERQDGRKYMWDLPGGTLAGHERPVDGLYREVYEETRLTIELVSPLCWLKWDRHDSGQAILVAFYVAETSVPEVALSEEHAGFRWVTIDEFDRENLSVPAEREIVNECFALYQRFRCSP